MLLARIDDQLNIIVHDIFEWMEIFDSGLVNEIEINVDEDNLDTFFPRWRTYIDEERPYETLKIEDYKQIKKISIVMATELKDIRGDKLTEGEGVYEVIDYRFDFGLDEDEIEEEEPFASFLRYTGLITYTVKPDLPGF